MCSKPIYYKVTQHFLRAESDLYLIPFILPGFVIDGVQMVGPTLTLIIDARVVRPLVACPDCQQPSSHIHSRFIRTPRDLPLREQQVRLRLLVRRFFCSSPECPRRTFAERLPELLPAHAQRTSHFTQALQTLGFALRGCPAARTASKLRLPVSRMTCVRVLRASAQPAFPTPDVLGVDDFAFRKGHVYGTILVDLLQRRPIDLLPDRTAEAFANWLRAHPGISTIVRDRSTEYARGASEGAPQAQQVVDRWHLLVNFRDALARLLTRQHAHLCALPSSQVFKDQLAQRQQQQPRPLRQPSAKEATRRQARRAQRYARYELVGVEHTRPFKKPKGGKLSAEQKAHNRLVAQHRIVVKHVIRCVKRCRMVKDTIRLWKDGLKDMVMEVSCGLHNFRLHTTPWPSIRS